MKNYYSYAKIFILFISVSFFSCKKIDCKKCKGSGKITKQITTEEMYDEPVDYYVSSTCSKCRGRGQRNCMYQFTNTGFLSITEYECDRGRYRAMDGGGMNVGQLSGQRCGQCGGSGYVNCRSCKGYGTRKIKKTKIEKKTRKVKKDTLVIDSYCKGKGKVFEIFE
ncbi:hypothetical protein [Tenacibaculum agarivorans]|uniref:hypothetical protein n=1 Tax=Tenacibaculum agarivorans TaxID=1908389 RepID=UPI00094B9C34|nr:hypothetical protein [Tenacibaculum agarivorans]